MGHMWDTLHEGVDIILLLNKIFLLRILLVDCDEIWHGSPLVIKLKHAPRLRENITDLRNNQWIDTSSYIHAAPHLNMIR